ALEPSGDLAGIVRYAADPDRERAEFGILVRSDLAGRGLGRSLMQHLIAYSRAEGLGRLEGMVLAENSRLLALCRGLGAESAADPEEPGRRRVWWDTGAAPAPA